MEDGNTHTDLLEKPSGPTLGAGLLLAAITVVSHSSSDGYERAFAGERAGRTCKVRGSMVCEEVRKAMITVGV